MNGLPSTRCMLVLTLAFTILWNGSALAGGEEILNFKLFQPPKFSGSNELGPLQRTLVVLEGASTDEWTEAIEILTTKRKGAYKKPDEVASGLRAMRREHCGVVSDSILASDESSVFWSMSSDSCFLAGPQFSMTRVLCGTKTTFILIYTSTNPNVAAERRAQVASAFSTASVLKP